uniref:Mitogen-activated protein kinase kinase kinase A n=1 Tax=Aegilops tauschii TaxID=37682 RepID=M8CA07_AEGTA
MAIAFAPGGSLADEAARNGGRLEERAIRAYAADVLRGLAYIHGKSLVHGDVKSRNVVIGADGRAKIADFGCARALGAAGPIGGTPAFMAPEVARGEEQGPAADVWALGCTVVEMATGRAPWGEMDNVLAAVHRIGYTDAVPEVPTCLSAEAKSSLAMCFARNARDRCTAAQLLEHPFVALQAGEAKARWVSPKSTLDAAFWESETEEEEEEEEVSESPCERIKSLACSVLPDWDSDEGWMDVLGEQCEACDSPATKGPADVSSRAPSKVLGSPAVPAEDVAVVGTLSSDEHELDAEDEPFGDDIILAADPLVDRQIEGSGKMGYMPLPAAPGSQPPKPPPREKPVLSSSERRIAMHLWPLDMGPGGRRRLTQPKYHRFHHAALLPHAISTSTTGGAAAVLG